MSSRGGGSGRGGGRSGGGPCRCGGGSGGGRHRSSREDLDEDMHHRRIASVGAARRASLHYIKHQKPVPRKLRRYYKADVTDSTDSDKEVVHAPRTPATPPQARRYVGENSQGSSSQTRALFDEDFPRDEIEESSLLERAMALSAETRAAELQRDEEELQQVLAQLRVMEEDTIPIVVLNDD